MDANGYHPFGARVVTPATPNETLPELLQQARAGVLDPDLASVPTAHRSPTTGSPTTGSLITELLAGRIPVGHPEAQVYRLLLVAASNYYHRLMPFRFEKIGDATELLLPEDLLTEHSVAHDFRIREAYEAFRRSGHGDQALRHDGTRTGHHGLTDPKEFFAEMTEAFFGSNDCRVPPPGRANDGTSRVHRAPPRCIPRLLVGARRGRFTNNLGMHWHRLEPARPA